MLTNMWSLASLLSVNNSDWLISVFYHVVRLNLLAAIKLIDGAADACPRTTAPSD